MRVSRQTSGQECNARGTAYGRVMAGECEQARVAVNPERGDVIAAPVAYVEEFAVRTDATLDGIIAERGCFTDVIEPAA